MMNDWSSWGGGSWGGMWFGPLFMLLFLGLFVAGVVALVRWIGGNDRLSSSTSPPPQTAREILDQRFARGEIDAGEYQARRHALEI